MDGVRLSPIWGDAPHHILRSCESRPIPVIHLSDPPSQSSTVRCPNLSCFDSGIFKGFKHLKFINGAQTLPPPTPMILDVLQAGSLLKMFIYTCHILPNPRHTCTVATFPNVRRLCATSYAVSRTFHPIDVPASANIGITRSFCNVTESGVNVLFARGPPLERSFGGNAGCYSPPQHQHDVWQDEELPWRSYYRRGERYANRRVRAE